MVNVFITGATGYIGGDVLHTLYAAHPEYAYSALVRTTEKGNAVTERFPGVRVVLGDNDEYEVLRGEAAWADVVVHTADSSDHPGAAHALADGLATGRSDGGNNAAYWLHTGGTGILTYFDSAAGRLGEREDAQFDDWEGVQTLTGGLPQEAFHRNVDEIVLASGRGNGGRGREVRTAIVCPPTIYGAGRGPSLVRGRQVYELAKATLEIGKGPIIGKGQARWNNVHVHDLSKAYLLLVEAAAAGNSDPELWGDKGYYFTENGEHYWGELSERIARCANELSYISSAETESMDEEKAKETAGFESLSWGWNSRGKAMRLTKLLGWQPKEGSIEDEVPTIVKSEWERLQRG